MRPKIQFHEKIQVLSLGKNERKKKLIECAHAYVKGTIQFFFYLLGRSELSRILGKQGVLRTLGKQGRMRKCIQKV